MEIEKMSPDVLRGICIKHDLYRTPELNSTLYCNLKGFRKIANLEPYTGLVSLFLEGNAIPSLDGLPFMPQLRCLYLQQNVFSSLDGLDRVPGIETLNISRNALSSLDGLQHCCALTTLLCSQNELTGHDSLGALIHCKALSTVDLQDNNLDADVAFDSLGRLPCLGCLYLKGNPVAATTKGYRKTLICSFPLLTYLDDRPIFDKERRCAEAWKKGGSEEEKAERERMVLEAGQQEEAAYEAVQRLRKEGFRKRRESLGLPPGDSDPFFELSNGALWQEQEEPPELQHARQQLHATTGITEVPAADNVAGFEDDGKGSSEPSSSELSPADEEEAFMRESAAYTEHLGAALPRLLPAAEGAAQRVSIAELAPETAEASLLQPDEQEHAEGSSVREIAKPMPIMAPSKSGAGRLKHKIVLNSSLEDLSEELEQAAGVKARLAPVSAARTPLAPLPEAGSNAQAPSRRTPRKASRHRSTFTFDKKRG